MDEKLLADVVHKIKNSLGGIGGFATLLDRDLESGDPRKRLAQRIQDGVNNVNDIVVSLMTLVRQTSPRHEKVKLCSLIRGVCCDYWFNDPDRCESVAIQDFSSNGDMELFADTTLIQKMIFHTIHFLDLVEFNINSIHMNMISDNKIQIGLVENQQTKSQSKIKDINRFMKEGEPVEARLSLAIAEKMVEVYGGKLLMEATPDTGKTLILQFMRGN